MILVLRVPETIVRFSGSLEGLRELRKALITVHYSERIWIKVGKEE